MALPNHDEIVALGREAISADRPVGDPCRYEESFQQLQGQLDRLGSLTGEVVEWPRVVDLATEILKTKSKDLLVMTYLAVGLFQRHGYAGLATGLETYCEFLRNFWEKCFPKVTPPMGRYNAVQYLADRLLPEVELREGRIKREPRADERAALEQCAEQVDKLAATVEELFRTLPNVPNLASLKRALRALQEKYAAAEPREAAGGPGTVTSGATAGMAPAAAVAGAVPETFTSAAQAVQAIVRIAKYLFAQDSQDGRSYQLMRAAHFGGLRAAPQDGFLPPIPPQRRQALDGLAQAGNWQELLNEAEGQFAVTPLWLDLQRYVAVALKGLGPAWGVAHDAVVTAAAALHARLPALFDLTFKDRTPLADGVTKAWIGELAVQGGGGDGHAGAGDCVAEAAVEARKLLSESKPTEAVARLSDMVATAAGRRQRYRAEVELARLLVGMNRLNLAAGLLEELDRQAEEWGLTDWEPELAGEVVVLLLECLRRLKPKPAPEDVQRTGQLFARLCRLDPGAALKLDSSGNP
jgi:type VI secretion system protein VasJ